MALPSDRPGNHERDLAPWFGEDYYADVTSREIIEEIKRLPSAEREKVLEFARVGAENRQLTGKEIAELTRKMTETPDPAEAARLEEEIVRGFYGSEPHA